MWKRLDLPLKVLGAAFAILVALVSLASAAAAIFGNPFAPDPISLEAFKTPAAITAYEVNKCMRRHELAVPRQRVETRLKTRVRHLETGWRIVFKRCDWPPLAPASEDGYSEVVADSWWIPGHGAVDEYAILLQIRAPCEELLLTSVVSHMYGRVFGTTRLLQGRLIAVYDRWDGRHETVAIRPLEHVPPEVSPPYSLDRHFNVLMGGHLELYDARCRA